MCRESRRKDFMLPEGDKDGARVERYLSRSLKEDRNYTKCS